jgi:hypothetical protein
VFLSEEMKLMMRSIIKYCLFCVFLCKGFSGNAVSPGNLAYADSLFNAANYKLAAMEYERAYFFSVDSFEKEIALLKKSYCQKNLNDFEKAYKTLQRITLINIPDSIQFKVLYEKVLLSYLSGNPQQAETEIVELDVKIRDYQLLNKYLFLKVIVKNELLKWNEADSLLKLYFQLNKSDANSTEMTSLLKKPRIRNPRTARTISYLIPGGGQIYTYHIFQGLTSFALQGTFLYYTIASIKNGFLISGLTLGAGIFQMFYFGGARYAYYLAEKNNAKKISLYNKKIKDFLLNTERSKV